MSRDDQFAGFAELLFNEMKPDLAMLIVDVGKKDTASILQTEAIIKQMIARRAYDFACHITEQVSEGNAAAIEVRFKTPQEVVSDMRDMTAWPEETSK